MIDPHELSSSESAKVIDRVAVLAETESTQDAALRLADGRAGLMVVAVRQTAGRGRLGRSWEDTSHLGLAATFVLRAEDYSPQYLSLAAGVATALTVSGALEGGRGLMGVRWPNDVVESKPPYRKIAGVLVEVHGNLALVGIGINVLQSATDWSPELRDRAVSLFQIVPRKLDRCDAARSLLGSLRKVLGKSPEWLSERWSGGDILRNTRRSFIHNNQAYTGLVRSIDPTNCILLQLDDGSVKSLPALTTSLVHE